MIQTGLGKFEYYNNPIMSKPKYENNYLSEDNGCQVVASTSQKERGPAASIISSDPKSVWVTDDGLPQECTISVEKIRKKPVFFNTLGVYCWHQYDSNPAVIELWVRNAGAGMRLLSKIRLALLDTWQYFKIEELMVDKLKEVRIRVVQTYGDGRTYINKISMHCISYQKNEPISAAIEHSQLPAATSLSRNPPREKVLSQYHKPDETSRELKKAQDRITRLTEQQESMKKTILEQERVIINIQETLKAVLIGMDRMQKMYEMGQMGSGRGSRDRRETRDVKRSEEKGQEQVQQRRQQKQISQLKRMLQKLQYQTLAEPRASSQAKLGHLHPLASHQPTEVIRTNSEQDLSEYSHTHYKTSLTHHHYDSNSHNNSTHKTSNKGEKAVLVDKLKKLLELRQKKKSLELRQSGGRGQRGSRYHQPDEDSDSHEDNY